MKTILTLSLLAAASAAFAVPSTFKKGTPDAYGVTSYWVKCDNGNVTVVQCFRDTQRCGERSDQALQQVAIAACDSMQGLTMEPIKK